MIGWALRQLAIWIVFAAAMLAVVSFWREHPRQPGPPADEASAATAQPPRPSITNALVFHANKQGHVLLEAFVNGAAVRFLVDTGATYVALSQQDATAAGIARSDLVYRGSASTANGVARVAPVRLRELRVAQFAAADVPAVVMENLAMSLLGQSFLSRLDGYEMRDGVLTLNWN